MTKKKTQTNVVEKATTVEKKSTESIKKPTIASLKKEQANLTEQLQYANKRVLELLAELAIVKVERDFNYETIQSVTKNRQESNKEILRLKESLDNHDRQIKELTTPLWKKAVDKINQLFGD
jgi:hypothetical protein